MIAINIHIANIQDLSFFFDLAAIDIVTAVLETIAHKKLVSIIHAFRPKYFVRKYHIKLSHEISIIISQNENGMRIHQGSIGCRGKKGSIAHESVKNSSAHIHSFSFSHSAKICIFSLNVSIVAKNIVIKIAITGSQYQTNTQIQNESAEDNSVVIQALHSTNVQYVYAIAININTLVNNITGKYGNDSKNVEVVQRQQSIAKVLIHTKLWFCLLIDVISRLIHKKAPRSIDIINLNTKFEYINSLIFY